MKTLVKTYSELDDLVLDPFAGSYETGCACMLLRLHRRFILGDKDEDCSKLAKGNCSIAPMSSSELLFR